MQTQSEILDLLRGRNLKATPMRVEVLKVIAGYQKAIPYSIIQHSLPNHDRVTLYRTLLSFIECGIIHKALHDENETYYAICAHSCTLEGHHHQHIHFKCTKCLTVSCVRSENEVQIVLPGYIIQEIAIDVSGLCPQCH